MQIRNPQKIPFKETLRGKLGLGILSVRGGWSAALNYPLWGRFTVGQIYYGNCAIIWCTSLTLNLLCVLDPLVPHPAGGVA